MRHRNERVSLLLLLLIAGSVLLLSRSLASLPVQARELEWERLQTSGVPPTARLYAAAIYDPVDGRMIVYGGWNLRSEDDFGLEIYDDVWELQLEPDQAKWEELRPVGRSPGRRAFHTAVYDAGNHRMIVFGGMDHRFSPDSSSDVWALDLTVDPPQWDEILRVNTGPDGRTDASAIYDRQKQRMILYGGLDSRDSERSDVWALSLIPGSEEWNELTPSGQPAPSARAGHSAVYDSVNERMLVWNGAAFSRSRGWGLIQDGTWSFDLQQPGWTRLETAGQPKAVIWSRAIASSCSDQAIVFGGYTLTKSLNEVWKFDMGRSGQWERSPISGGPRPRDSYVAAFDERNQRIVYFSGWDLTGVALNDTWALSVPCAPEPTATATSVPPTLTLPSSATPTPTPTFEPTPTFPAVTAAPIATASTTPTSTPTPSNLYMPLLVHDQGCPPQKIFTDVALVIDASTTMDLPVGPGLPRKIDVVADNVLRFVDSFLVPNREDNVGVVLFNVSAAQRQVLTRIRPRLVEALDVARGELHQYSQVHLGIAEAVKMLHDSEFAEPSHRKVMILITDGLVNPGGPADVLREAEKAREAGVVIYAIGYGATRDDELLVRTANSPVADHEYYFPSPTDAEFDQIIDRLHITVWCPPDIYWPRFRLP